MQEYELLTQVLSNLSQHKQDSLTPIFICGGNKDLDDLISEFKRRYILSFPLDKVVHVYSVDFLEDFMHAIREGKTHSYQQYFSNCDLLIFENIESISGREAAMETIYLILDALIEKKRCVIITSEFLPWESPRMADRIIAKIEGGLIFNLRNMISEQINS